MWLLGCPNPYKMEQSWECTFLRLFTHTNPKSASKIIFIIGLKNYYLSGTANVALMGRFGIACLLVSLKSNDRICFWCRFCICMGKESQKSALPTLFHFARVRSVSQPHMQPGLKSSNCSDCTAWTYFSYMWSCDHQIKSSRIQLIMKVNASKLCRFECFLNYPK